MPDVPSAYDVTRLKAKYYSLKATFYRERAKTLKREGKLQHKLERMESDNQRLRERLDEFPNQTPATFGELADLAALRQ